jgi:DNA-directed RNA polymerase specialized sigma24 family protein
LQSAFARGIEKGGALRAEEGIVAWFYRLLRNAIIDYLPASRLLRTHGQRTVA